MNKPEIIDALFRHGQLVGTPAALQLLANNSITPFSLLMRHITGDWGDVCKQDAKANELSLSDGSRIFSVYAVGEERLYVITEAMNDEGQRESTCILLPEEY